LLGTSRKRFLADLGHEHLEADDRLEGTIATIALAATAGVAMVRVHDVAAAVRVRELAAPRQGEGVA
jgi:dihydropteroate synthase